jgi:DNA polymerase III subunit gamma/tau
MIPLRADYLRPHMSQFVVSARKYRPQRFEDVVGQQHIAQTLKNALATDHVAHAFLFCGPRGVGKTTCARILARILNCQQRTPDFEACNTCSSCSAFNENASFNIIELDAASNNSVEHIRALVEQVRFRPQEGQYKVFIIDEVHMLSNAAFNAFLKTLEEPPPYAIFILATTEKHKIIPTILSRCQIFDFRRITVADTVAHLQYICTQEGIEAEEDALHIISQKADGALRDALSIFDRITSFGGKQIRYTDVIEHLNVLDYDYYFQITDALLVEDLPGVLRHFDQILRKGFEADTFVSGLAEHLRNILVTKDPSTLALLETGENLRERYRRQAEVAPVSFLLSALGICNDCDINYKMARNKRLHVEMSLIKLCYIGRTIAAAQQPVAVAPTEKKSPDLTSGTTVPPSNGGNAAEIGRDALSTLSAQVGLGQKKVERIPLSLAAFEEAVAVEQATLATRQSLLSLALAQQHWQQYAQQVESPSLRQAMTQAILNLEDKTLVATVGMNVQLGLLQQENTRVLDFLRHHLQDLGVKLLIQLDETKAAEVLQSAAARPVRPLTVRERLEALKEHNPDIGDLIARFDLRIDD